MIVPQSAPDLPALSEWGKRGVVLHTPSRLFTNMIIAIGVGTIVLSVIAWNPIMTLIGVGILVIGVVKIGMK